MGNRGRPPEGPINRTVASFWVAHVVRVTGVKDGRSFAREILERPDWADAFARYEKAANAPQWPSDDPLAAAALALAESKVPGSIHYISSPMWRLIQSRDVSAEQLAEWNSRITEERAYLARLTDSPDNLRSPDREAELTFHHLEAIIALLHEARLSGDCASTGEIIRVFALLRTAFLKSPFATGFEHTLLPVVSDWVGEAVARAAGSPERIADCDMSALQIAEMRTAKLKPEALSALHRVLLSVAAIALAAILVWADNAPASQVALLVIALLGCLVVLSAPSREEKLPAHDHR